MKLRYKIDRSVDIEPDRIIKKIYKELEGPVYKITHESANAIAFKSSIWVWQERSAGLSQLDGGTFSITSDKKTSVCLSYFISLENEILLMSFFVIMGIIVDFHIFFLILLIVIMFPISVMSSKYTAKKMLQNVTSQE